MLYVLWITEEKKKVNLGGFNSQTVQNERRGYGSRCNFTKVLNINASKFSSYCE